LHRRQPAEKTPGQTGVVGKDDPMRLQNHAGYIANHGNRHNEGWFVAARAERSVCCRGPRADISGDQRWNVTRIRSRRRVAERPGSGNKLATLVLA